MIPASFEESNRVLGRPPSMTEDQCDPLNVFVNGKYVVSCWKLTAEELDEFQRTGRIWLLVVGASMPPVLLTAIKPLGVKPTG